MADEGNTMDNKLYNEKASSQAVAHDLTKASLVKCVEEVMHKYHGTLKMCDLGSAGGVNAIKLLSWILPLVGDRKVEYVFEDLPNADLNELAKTIHGAGLPKNILTSIIGKSFYEPLFGPESVHISLSYITLHWLRAIPDLSSFPVEQLRFLNANERDVDPEVEKAFRAEAKKDLALFLRLRAKELVDGGVGLYLMVSDQRQGQSNSNIIRATPKSLFTMAFDNAAAEFEKIGQSDMAFLTREALAATKFPQFFRCERDIRETLRDVKDVLDLVEVHADEVLVDNKNGAGLADFFWSIHGNCIKASLRSWAKTLKDDRISNEPDLTSIILSAWRKQFKLLAEKHYPDGKNYISYMYFVVERRPRA